MFTSTWRFCAMIARYACAVATAICLRTSAVDEIRDLDLIARLAAAAHRDAASTGMLRSRGNRRLVARLDHRAVERRARCSASTLRVSPHSRRQRRRARLLQQPFGAQDRFAACATVGLFASARVDRLLERHAFHRPGPLAAAPASAPPA